MAACIESDYADLLLRDGVCWCVVCYPVAHLLFEQRRMAAIYPRPHGKVGVLRGMDVDERRRNEASC